VECDLATGAGFPLDRIAQIDWDCYYPLLSGQEQAEYALPVACCCPLLLLTPRRPLPRYTIQQMLEAVENGECTQRGSGASALERFLEQGVDADASIDETVRLTDAAAAAADG